MAKKEPGDSRLNVARYQVERLSKELGGEGDNAPADEDETDNAGQTTMEQFDQFVEISVQQAMRRGDFDNLPGAGKPIPNLTQTYDPNWWVRRKIEREQLTGLGPPALTLRTEDERLQARLDAAPSEHAVREILEEFNRRVIEARRQLMGGPPVITRPRDVRAEVEAWHERRMARLREREREREAERLARMSWRERRRARKSREGG